MTTTQEGLVTKHSVAVRQFVYGIFDRTELVYGILRKTHSCTEYLKGLDGFGYDDETYLLTTKTRSSCLLEKMKEI